MYINLVNENDVTNIQYNALPEYFITPTEYFVSDLIKNKISDIILDINMLLKNILSVIFVLLVILSVI